MSARFAPLASGVLHGAVLMLLSMATLRAPATMKSTAGSAIDIVDVRRMVPRAQAAPPSAQVAEGLAAAPPQSPHSSSQKAPARPLPQLAPTPRLAPTPHLAPGPSAAPASLQPAPILRALAPPARLDIGALDRALAKTPARVPGRLNPAAIGAAIGTAASPAPRMLTFRQRLDLEDRIRSQITPCWSPPPVPDDAGRVSVLVRLRIERSGSLASPPVIASNEGRTEQNAAYADALGASVRRAVLRCAPFRLPAELYDAWADVELNFDPKDMP